MSKQKEVILQSRLDDNESEENAKDMNENTETEPESLIKASKAKVIYDGPDVTIMKKDCSEESNTSGYTDTQAIVWSNDTRGVPVEENKLQKILNDMADFIESLPQKYRKQGEALFTKYDKRLTTYIMGNKRRRERAHREHKRAIKDRHRGWKAGNATKTHSLNAKHWNILVKAVMERHGMKLMKAREYVANNVWTQDLLNTFALPDKTKQSLTGRVTLTWLNDNRCGRNLGT